MKNGDVVIIKPQGPYKTYFSARMTQYKDNSIIGTVSMPNVTPDYVYPSYNFSTYINFLSNIDGNSYFSMHVEDLEVVPENKLQELTEKAEKYCMEKYKPFYAYRDSFKVKAAKGYMKKDFTTLDLVRPSGYTSPSLVFVRQVNFDKDFQAGTVHFNKYLQGCCDFIKTTLSFEYYLPQGYLNHYNYTVLDVGRWLNFIKSLGIDFEYDLETNVNLDKGLLSSYVSRSNSVCNNPEGDYIFHGCNFWPLSNHSCVKIKVRSGKTPWTNYLYLLLIRYLQHGYYHKIPIIAMQIRDVVKEATPFQCLLMAHMYKYTTGTNGLIKEHCCVNIFQPVSKILENIDGGMNSSFEYSINKYDRVHCEQLIAKKEYQQLFDYLKKQYGI